MKRNNSIICYNVNGHRPVNKTISFDQKLKDTEKYIKAKYGFPLIVMFQELVHEVLKFSLN